MALPETGRYFITNVAQQNLAAIQDANPGSPVVGEVNNGGARQKWNVVKLSNGNYYIDNYGSPGLYAITENRPRAGAPTSVENQPKQWVLTEGPTGVLITPLDGRTLFWHLEDATVGTPVTLENGPNDDINQWTFAPAPF